MKYYSVLVDVFEEKETILETFSDNELKEELERREEEDDHVEFSKNSLDIYYDLYLSEHYDDILSEEFSDTEIFDEAELRAYSIKPIKNIQYDNLKNIICDYIGFRNWATKEQILKELDNYL